MDNQKAKPEVDKFVQELEKNDNKVNGKKVKVVKVNADENKELAEEYNVRGLFHLLLLQMEVVKN